MRRECPNEGGDGASLPCPITDALCADAGPSRSSTPPLLVGRNVKVVGQCPECHCRRPHLELEATGTGEPADRVHCGRAGRRDAEDRREGRMRPVIDRRVVNCPAPHLAADGALVEVALAADRPRSSRRRRTIEPAPRQPRWVSRAQCWLTGPSGQLPSPSPNGASSWQSSPLTPASRGRRCSVRLRGAPALLVQVPHGRYHRTVDIAATRSLRVPRARRARALLPELGVAARARRRERDGDVTAVGVGEIDRRVAIRAPGFGGQSRLVAPKRRIRRNAVDVAGQTVPHPT